MRSVVVSLLLAGVALAQDSPARPQMPIAPRPNQVRGDEITAAQRAAVEKGLARLASRQRNDGSFGTTNDGFGATSAVTALAGLAFMQDGNLPGRGKYGQHVERCVQYILNAAQESGLLVSEQAHAVMYSHGFAALFLAEVYGMTADEQVKERLQKAIRLIQKTQNPQGGWRYQPVPYDADISVTICQVMALRAARDAGIKVEKEVIDKAIEYVRACQNPDGGFNYQLGPGGSGSAFPRSAAGVAALYYAGVFEGDDLKRGLDYLLRFKPGRATNTSPSSHYFYGQYYAVQAMFLAGDDYWAQWYPAIRDELIKRQDPNGAWNGEISEDYCTASALIILQMPNRYLPVFSGKGPGN
ncbi:prenyltransferase/squalene oxidase repeat-containing protein [Fontivita pretiosa]|uniref:prenyltransferase/squalene oxidase repeat-containing protein n=1 Tax=Fontivita pretiosa TaxID=2989684 RepID=UPI003D16280C